MMDEGDGHGLFPHDRANEEGDSAVPVGVRGGPNAGDQGNLES
jgi:hypothetical protein